MPALGRFATFMTSSRSKESAMTADIAYVFNRWSRSLSMSSAHALAILVGHSADAQSFRQLACAMFQRKFQGCIMIRVNSSICVALSVFLFAGSPGIQAAEIVKHDDGPFAGKGRPYSESARVGDLLFLTGQTGEDKDGNLVAGGIKAEAEQVMLNIKAALARRGLAMEHVVKCTVFLADITEWAAFNEVYKRHFSQPYPARSALGASGLVDKARVEMECIAGYPR
jgi:reactive intermediate/imine deaminase